MVLGVCYCLAPLHSRGSGREKAACLFKGTGGWSQGREWRGEGGGERGAEAARAATQLSDIISPTERRHLRHSRKTARKQDYCFALFVLDYSLLDISDSSRWCIILPPDEKQDYSQSVEEQRLRDAEHKARSPESSAALLLMRAGLTPPLHCSTVSSAGAHLL